MMLVALVVSVVADAARPDTSAEAIVTAPVRPATLVTFADTVPDETDRPEPTTTAPEVVVVAAGSRAAETVPVVRSDAEPLVATAASPVIVPAACVPVCVERSRSWASVALAVAPVAMLSSFVFSADVKAVV